MAKGKKADGTTTEGIRESNADIAKGEESRKLALEVERKVQRDKIALEERLSAVNQKKIQTRWREIMQQAKTEELKHQLDTMREAHARRIDRKNFALASLGKDLEESEQQYSTALQSHLISIDTLVELQNSRLDNLKARMEIDVGMLDEEFSTERIKLQAQHAKEKSDLLGIMARAEQEFQDSEADARHENSGVKDDLKNKNLEEKHALRIQLEGSVEDLWRQFQSALNSYNSSTDERKRSFIELKSKDQRNAKEIEQQMKRLSKLQDSILGIKTKLTGHTKEFEDSNKSLREEKDDIQAQFLKLKKRMNSIRDGEHQKLSNLASLSNRTIKSLRLKVQKAENIIKLAEMNRKLETTSEKVLPFYEETEFEGEVEEEGGLNEMEFPPEFNGMIQFNKRFNKVYLDQIGLEKKRKSLREENNHLRNIMKQYLDGITINEDVLNQLNPLIVVNGRTNAPILRTGTVNITYVEASHCVSK